MNKRLLIIRFSALGDVTMAIHLIKALIQDNSGLEIFFLSKPVFYQLLKDLPVRIIENDLKNKHKGLIGLYRLSREIKKYNIDSVADIHGVIRSYIIDFFMFIHGKKVRIINKERKKKKKIIKGKNVKIKHTFERYAEVVKKLGFNIDTLHYTPEFIYNLSPEIEAKFIKKNTPNIGLAPFAAHKTKQYPLGKMEQVIKLLDDKGYNMLIFGGGQKEKEQAEKWEKKYNRVKSVISKLSMYEEVGLIKKLDAIVTMDSGNMHLASLVQTPNIIIWGGTHPQMGFTPIKNYNPQLSIIKNLSCQPCSVFGTNHCKRRDYACLYQILPEEIVERIEIAIKQSKN